MRMEKTARRESSSAGSAVETVGKSADFSKRGVKPSVLHGAAVSTARPVRFLRLECFVCGYSWKVSKKDFAVHEFEEGDFYTPEELRELGGELDCPFCARGYWQWNDKEGWVPYSNFSGRRLSEAEVKESLEAARKDWKSKAL